MPISYTINNLLVNTVVNIINIINKYDFTILIYFYGFFYLYTTPQALILIVFKVIHLNIG